MVRWSALYSTLAHWPLLWRIVIFFVSLLVLWLPLALVTYGVYALGLTEVAAIFSLLSLYLCFIGHAWLWARWCHRWRRPFQAYGLVLSWHFAKHTVTALLAGFALVGLLFVIQVLLGWAIVQPGAWAWIALEGFLVGLGVSFAEELLFRGWLLTELQTGLSRSQAIVWSSVIFAVAHFIKPIPEILNTSPQFLGLMVLGLILASSRYSRSQPSLAMPIGLHAGLVWGYYIVDVADLVIPSGNVSAWVTGIHGNPLSGALGLAILVCLTGFLWTRLRSK